MHGSCFDLLKAHLGGFEGVVWREGDVQEENSSLVHGARGAQDGGAPLIDVVSFGPGTEGNTSNHKTIYIRTQLIIDSMNQRWNGNYRSV